MLLRSKHKVISRERGTQIISKLVNLPSDCKYTHSRIARLPALPPCQIHSRRMPRQTLCQHSKGAKTSKDLHPNAKKTPVPTPLPSHKS
jgi:hypothetical protein